MIRKAVWVLVSSGLLLGLLHLILTLPIYGRLSLEALWFAGSGLAVVCCALMNVVALRGGTSSNRWAIVLANLLVAGFFATAWPLLPSPQVAAGFMIFATLAAVSAWSCGRPASP
ncbi:hypothetical protein [Brevundimonas sp.]|jgi:hypothetical protein|uniref:hypothetical protein n=2 Tax=Brevundimonas sp. TaxID=1871086 RepID=UPI0022BDFC8B|nr:hypothetical protein [Brevundimonas sp.]